MIRVDFDPPQALAAISGVGPKLAQDIIYLRETASNLEPENLEVLIKLPLGERESHWLDFASNQSPVAESTASEKEKVTTDS
ncbi:hypothetical protein DPMN_153801 [Dreissena polymorpha]|uniref:Uncharacterized protein n=1 Tax=Dreissena polymorpha TaxID=45954 RepID=A0A9D4FKT0_DREPO|nr:hypothetical protein DPMN_153801 [Dreissena polymorpha]